MQSFPHTSHPKPPRESGVRIAHLTDAHVEPGGDSEAGLTRCLEHVHRMTDKPDIIFNGGDAIMNAFGRDEARVSAQWEVWDRVMRAHCRIPLVHCLGNHDVWTLEPPPHAGEDPMLLGKKRAMHVLGLQARYYSFDLGAWHIIVLDSTFLHDNYYLGKIDDVQFAWLESDIGQVSASRPILILSHIPILSACVFFDGDNEGESEWGVPGAWMHIDARRLKNLFHRHPNIRVCLSGHIHLLDRVDYNGVTYLCNGAVCGAWWDGFYQECPPGYAVVDLYNDGTFDRQYVAY